MIEVGVEIVAIGEFGKASSDELLACIAQHGAERRIHIEKTSFKIDMGYADAYDVERVVEERALMILGFAEFFQLRAKSGDFVTFVPVLRLNRHATLR